MSETEKPSPWNAAALDGLILSSITVVFTTLSLLVSNSFAGTAFWAVRTAGSIYLLIFLIKRYISEVPQQRAFGYGTAVCLFSSIICAAWNFVCYKFIFPSKVSETFEQLYSQFSQMNLPAETMDMMYMMEDNYAVIMFVSSLIGAFLFGLIASAIIQGSLERRKDIFAGTDSNKEEEEDF